jgi:hypothetical protein
VYMCSNWWWSTVGEQSATQTPSLPSAELKSESSLYEKLAACQFYQYNQMQPEDSRVFPEPTPANHMYKAIQAGKAQVSGHPGAWVHVSLSWLVLGCSQSEPCLNSPHRQQHLDVVLLWQEGGVGIESV